jgi:hypothetical protein
MPQDPAEAGGSVEREVTAPRSSPFRRPLVLVLVCLGLVSGGAAITATAAGAASSSSETATVQESSSDASATQAQEGEEGNETQRDCPEKAEAEESA